MTITATDVIAMCKYVIGVHGIKGACAECIEEGLRVAREQERETCISVACHYCRDGHAPEERGRDGRPLHLGAYTGHVATFCAATAIRERGEAATPEGRNP